VDRCPAALDHPRFARHIETDGRLVADIVAEIRDAMSA